MNQLNPFQAAELDELETMGLLDESDDGSRDRFKITDVSSLTWAFRKIGALEAQLKVNAEVAEEQRAVINAWEEKESKDLNGSIDFFKHLIREYAEERRNGDEKFKKESTPYGTVSLKAQPPEWTFPDEKEVISFLKENDLETLVKTVPAEEKISNKTEFKKAFDIKQYVYSKNGKIVDQANELGVGLFYTYMLLETDEEPKIVELETGEIAKDVIYHEAVAVERMSEKIVPGVVVTVRPEKVEIKPTV